MQLSKRPWSLSRSQRLLIIAAAVLFLLAFRPWSQAPGYESVYVGAASMLVLAILPSGIRLLSALAIAVVFATLVLVGLDLFGVHA